MIGPSGYRPSWREGCHNDCAQHPLSREGTGPGAGAFASSFRLRYLLHSVLLVLYVTKVSAKLSAIGKKEGGEYMRGRPRNRKRVKSRRTECKFVNFGILVCLFWM